MRQGFWVLLGLVAGMGLGAFASADEKLASTLHQAAIIGPVWLDALRMTLVPLVFALLVAAVGGVAERAAAGPLARRALALFAGLIVFAAIYALGAVHAALEFFPLPPGAAQALTPSLAATGGAAPTATPLALDAWLRSLVPTNVVAAAAEDSFLQIVVFAILFGFAVSRLPQPRRSGLTSFFDAAGEAMIVIVRWVLLFAPFGVFGLALNLGLSSGFNALGALLHYVAIVSGATIGIIVLATGLAIAASHRSASETIRALLPVQIVAASTQSSLASLPAMLDAALGPLRVRPQTAEFTLPLAVAVFRLTSPVANLAVAIYVTQAYGVEPTWAQFAAAVAVAFAVSVSSVGLPGQTSFFSSIAPICVVMGTPVTLLPILLAVEIVPDVFRTVGNVTGDLAATLVLDRQGRKSDSGAL
jgi:Na+/H+-dicarboxylate symporter